MGYHLCSLPQGDQRNLTHAACKGGEASHDRGWPVEGELPPDRGAPPTISMEKLSSWSDNPDSGVKYFSGIGTYRKTIDVPAGWLKNHAHVWIDLGDVKNL